MILPFKVVSVLPLDRFKESKVQFRVEVFCPCNYVLILNVSVNVVYFCDL